MTRTSVLHPPLRAAREARGLSLRAAARAARLDPGHLSKVERGEEQLSIDALHRVAVVLELDGLAQEIGPYVRTQIEPVDAPAEITP